MCPFLVEDRLAVFRREQPQAFQILKNVLSRKAVSPAYLFNGPQGLGKETAALWFFRNLLCESQNDQPLACDSCSSCQYPIRNHPDLHIVKRPNRKRTISIQQVREEIRVPVSRKAFVGQMKGVFIPEAESLTLPAQNALLKTLEDPQANTVVVLSVASVQPLLPTVRSRCIRVPFRSLSFKDFAHRFASSEEIASSDLYELFIITGGDVLLADQIIHSDHASELWQQAKDLAGALLDGTLSPIAISKWSDLLSKELDYLRQFLLLLLVELRNRLEQNVFSEATAYAEAVHLISRAQQQVEANANRRLALEVALIKLQQVLCSPYNKSNQLGN